MRLFLLLLAQLAFIGASGQWTWRNPLPQGNTLYVINATDANSVWAAGDVGTVVHSSDGGATWDVRNDLSTAKYIRFYGLDFPDDSIGFAVDYFGHVFKTSDAGETWDSSYVEETELLNTSFFTDALHGYIFCSGGKIIRTSNGGFSWSSNYLTEAVDFSSAWFPSLQTGYASGFYGHIVKTTDAGDNWSFVYFDSGAIINDIVFPTPDLGFAAGENGLVLKTSDGGMTWVVQHLGDSLNFRSIAAFSADTLILDGYEEIPPWMSWSPVIYRSTDGGTSWMRLQQSGDIDLSHDLVALPGGTAYRTGFLGSILKTPDYGDTWIPLGSSAVLPSGAGGIWGINFPTPQTGYAVTGEYEGLPAMIMKTSDGGETWYALDTSFQWDFLSGVDFSTEEIGCIGGESIYRTEDGGQTWTLRMSGLGWTGIQSIAYAGSSVCCAVGQEGAFVRSTDGGKNWTHVTGVPDVDYETVCFADELTGYAAGPSTILKTTDGGATWDLINSDYSPTALDFINPDTGFGVGWNGLIIRTNDGGVSWDQLDNPTSETLFAVDFYDKDTGYAAGGNSSALLLKTTDGGDTWAQQFIPTNLQLFSVATTGNCAFAGGWGFNLFGTTNGGISVSSGPWTDQKGNSVSISPNPVHGMAIISYSLKEPSPVQIRVFDLRGSEVIKPVELFQSAGFRSTPVSMTGLPNGLYFYSVITRNSTLTGKLILVAGE